MNQYANEQRLLLSLFWGIYLEYFYTIRERISYFSILGFANIQKLLVVHELIKIRENFWYRLYMY